ncbi:hypothetical protein [Cellulomonas sp. SG140]|uniref:hypothetical protein n=1 Tax=Cellulomonas sp. SG140 TaxID=2976536 RepID=UPI0021E7B77F|nr:hypothetical protein [Cellulomonas sp. SG140]
MNRVQSGGGAALAILMGLRQPTDLVGQGWRIAAELRPLLDAQVRVLACGTPAAAAAAATVAESVSTYVNTAVATTTGQRLLMSVAPWWPLKSQEAALEERLADVSHAIGTFRDLMREELGEEPFPQAEIPRRTSRGDLRPGH